MDVSVTEMRPSYYQPPGPIKLCQTVSDYRSFASHPLEVNFQAWTTVSTFGNISNDIFALFLSTASGTPLGNKLSNLRFYTGKIKITVVVQGSPYAQGKMVYSFEPYNLNISNTAGTHIQPPQKVRSLYLPNIVIDPSKNASYQLDLPPCNAWGLYNVLGTNYGSWAWNFIAFNPLGSGTATEPVIGITTYFSIEDEHLSTLTYSSLNTKEEGKYSSFFARVAGISSYVANITPPRISAGLTLFSAASGVISKFLAHFGYGKHVIQEVNYVRSFNTANNLTCVDGKVDSSILSTRMVNGLSISPNDCPLLSQDDQMISSLCMKPGLVHQHYLLTTSPAATQLFHIPVSPSLVFTLDSPAIASNYELTTLAYCALPFRYWRGDIDVTIEAVCSVFHRATILVAYLPNNADFIVTYANAVQTVKTWSIQISGNSETKITIPWSQPEQYEAVSNVSNTTDSNANGNLSFYLVNPVTTNGSTDPIYLNIFYSSAEMFFGHPDCRKTNRYTLNLSAALAPINSVSPQTCSEVDSSFYSRFFGEHNPTSTKELANRSEFVYQLQDITRVPPNRVGFEAPADGFVNPSQIPATNDKVGYNYGTFSFLSSAYHGRRGSINYTWYPGIDLLQNNIHFSALFMYRIGFGMFNTFTDVIGTTAKETHSDAFATINPVNQYAASITVPYYNAFYTVNYPCAQGGEGVIFSVETDLTSPMTASGANGGAGCIFQSGGDDFNWVFFRGIPATLFT
jgi:hypothetical protein